MKQLSFLLIAFCILCFSACKKEDELSTKEKIVGKWKYENIEHRDYDGTDLVNTKTEDRDITIEFKSDGTSKSIAKAFGFVVTDEGVWKLLDNGKKLVITSEDNGPYAYIGDTSIVEKLNESTLQLLYEYDHRENGVTYRRETELKLSKLE